MRLARGSGLDGLTAMSEQRVFESRLRAAAAAARRQRARGCAPRSRRQRQTWIEDPSNDAERFERVRLRKARALLAGLGLTNDKIALSARRLARAQAALDAGARALAAESARLDLHAGAFASFDHAAWLRRARGTAPASAGASRRVLSADSPSRCAWRQLEALVDRLAQPGFEGATLAGAIVCAPRRRRARAARARADAAADPRVAAGHLRRVGRPLPRQRRDRGGRRRRRSRARRAGLRRAAPATRTCRADLPARAAATLPAFWRGDELIIAPDSGGAWTAYPPLGGWRQRLYSAEFLG